MNIEYEKPIKVYIDNLGELFLFKNRNTLERTRHIDSGYHFIREMVETGLIKSCMKIKSQENVADLFKKSLNVKLLSVCLVFAIATSRKKERIAFHATSSIP